MNVKNRGCIRRLSLKTLWASRKRNLIAVTAIALTAMLFTSLFTIALSINESYQTETFRQVGGYCHGTFKEVNAEQIAAISRHPKVKAVGQRKTIGLSYDGPLTKEPGELSWMDENCTKWSYAIPTVGRMPKEGKEITTDTRALELLGVTPELGAQVPLTYNVDDKTQQGIQITDTFTLVGWWEYDTVMPVHYLNISQEYADAIEEKSVAAGMEPFRVDLNVMMASSLDIRGRMEQVDKDLGYTWEEGYPNTVRIGVNWGYTTAQMSNSLDLQTVVAVGAFIALVVFTGYLIIYNIFQISVTGDIRFYGLLKTIGTTPRQLRRIIRHQALALCVLGIPIGLAIGWVVGALLTPQVLARLTITMSATTVSVSPLIFLVSGLFALVTVLMSCARPGRIASRVSPVEATRYTDVSSGAKSRSRRTQGAKVHQMAFANLGRNRLKTLLVVISLALAVVLLNVLIMFTGGFDMEKYLAKQTCADFIVSNPDYFRFDQGNTGISPETMEQIAAATDQTLSGRGYTGADPKVWVEEDVWRYAFKWLTPERQEVQLEHTAKKDGLLGLNMQLEGLDENLFDKLTVVEGDIAPLFQEGSNAIAIGVNTDDYGNVEDMDAYPPVGSTIPVSYVLDAYYIDSRTGEKADASTPDEYVEYYVASSREVEYTVCAYVIVPYSMSYRYGSLSLNAVLPVERMAKDSGQEPIPLFYLFDTPDLEREEAAEAFLQAFTENNSDLMYESKATLRADFDSFRQLFLLLGGLLCAIIGLVGALNFFNAIMTGVLTRQREFAVLQAVGMTGKQLRQMLVWEGLYYALGSAGGALLLCLIMTPLTGRMLENMFWFFSARFTVVPVLAAAPVFALLGWAVPRIMYHHAVRKSLVERLRESET